MDSRPPVTQHSIDINWSTSVTVSTAQATAQSPTSPTTSVHLKVNTKKAVRDGQNAGQRSSNVSIQYNRTVPAVANGPQGSGAEGESGNGGGPRIGVISHSSNITLRSKANNKAKSKGLEEDFPALSVSTKTTNAGMGSSGWGSTAAAPAPSVPASGHQLGTFCCTSAKPGKKLNPKDFPSLAPNPESQTHMKNYHGRSSVTIPVSNAWTHTVDQVPKASDGNETSSSKSKKKKKGSNKSAADVTSNSSANSNQSSSNNTSNSVSNGPSKPSTKKKPVGLHNIFDDDSDEDGVTMDLSMGKLGDYQSVAPVTSSNLNMITSDMVNERKKSELKIGTLRAPPPKLDNDDAFPSLGGSFSPSPLATSTWSSPAKNTAPPGFTSKPKVPPGFSATDMTFTSSSGEKFAISPTSEAAVSTSAFTAQPTTTYTFQLPPRFELRNKRLIKTIHDECKGDEDKFDCFKMLAGQLRSGDLSGHLYYEQCREVMGKATFHKILPELLVLLPDIKKQQEVLAAYRKVVGARLFHCVCRVCSLSAGSQPG
ncbi:E3 ubiquitin-protein ligase ZNF598-like [Penaeus monodon]|uniref:E3 ubiquitin-protein ligase ZNF598-like n=1 Tax=Penaeus monodon TaxID=6687 RepID=UPI0018A777B3|nr:E3 ubiquitin-protein ligase ZNF598-like [Penaeus monodon]